MLTSSKRKRLPEAYRFIGFRPLGKVPVLVIEDETAVYDSRVIVEFLDNGSPIGRLIPPRNRERIEAKLAERQSFIDTLARE